MLYLHNYFYQTVLLTNQNRTLLTFCIVILNFAICIKNQRGDFDFKNHRLNLSETKPKSEDNGLTKLVCQDSIQQ